MFLNNFPLYNNYVIAQLQKQLLSWSRTGKATVYSAVVAPVQVRVKFAKFWKRHDGVAITDRRREKRQLSSVLYLAIIEIT